MRSCNYKCIDVLRRCVCVILVGRAAAASGRLDYQEATPHQAHLLCSKAGVPLPFAKLLVLALLHHSYSR